MSFNPVNGHSDQFFDQHTIRVSKHATTGLKNEVNRRSKSAIGNYARKAIQHLFKPCTHMGKVWGRIHLKGMQALRHSWNYNTRVQHMEKAVNLKKNLDTFENRIIKKHNGRRWKLFVKLGLAGIKISNKVAKTNELYRFVNDEMRYWNSQSGPLFFNRTTPLIDHANKLSDFRACKNHAQQIYVDAPASALRTEYDLVDRNTNAIVRQLIMNCTETMIRDIKAKDLTNPNGFNFQTQVDRIEAEVLRIYNVNELYELPLSINLEMNKFRDVNQLNLFINQLCYQNSHVSRWHTLDEKYGFFRESNAYDDQIVELINNANLDPQIRLKLERAYQPKNILKAQIDARVAERERLQGEAQAILSTYHPPSINQDVITREAYYMQNWSHRRAEINALIGNIESPFFNGSPVAALNTILNDMRHAIAAAEAFRRQQATNQREQLLEAETNRFRQMNDQQLVENLQENSYLRGVLFNNLWHDRMNNSLAIDVNLHIRPFYQALVDRRLAAGQKLAMLQTMCNRLETNPQDLLSDLLEELDQENEDNLNQRYAKIDMYIIDPLTLELENLGLSDVTYVQTIEQLAQSNQHLRQLLEIEDLPEEELPIEEEEDLADVRDNANAAIPQNNMPFVFNTPVANPVASTSTQTSRAYFKIPVFANEETQALAKNAKIAAVSAINAIDDLEDLEEELDEVFSNLKDGIPLDKVVGHHEFLKPVYFNKIMEDENASITNAEKYVKHMRHPLTDTEVSKTDASQAEFHAILSDIIHMARLAKACSNEDVKKGLRLIVSAHLLGINPNLTKCVIEDDYIDDDFEWVTTADQYFYYSPDTVKNSVSGQCKVDDRLSNEQQRALIIEKSKELRCPRGASLNIDGDVLDKGKGFTVVGLEAIPLEVIAFIKDWKIFMELEEEDFSEDALRELLRSRNSPVNNSQ